MAVIYHTTIQPTKRELLAAWLPSRPWYRGGTRTPELVPAGGFRLDDPEGEVGIEFMAVADTGAPEPVTYLVPVTYRGAPLDGAEDALIGTMEHGVLGKRWTYDALRDPVALAQLLAFVEGRVEAQAQSETDTPAPEVTRAYTGSAALRAAPVPTAADNAEGTVLPLPGSTTLRLHRALRPNPEGSAPHGAGTVGHVEGPWQQPDGTPARGVLAVLTVEAGE